MPSSFQILIIPARLKITSLFLILSFLSSHTIFSATYPALPQIFIQTPFELPVGGQYIIASNSIAFQSALNSSQAGDIIQLQAGTIYT
ncbi:MAG: hypothetical protein ABJB16_15455, partial [Saprospiraceae bacterium]